VSIRRQWRYAVVSASEDDALLRLRSVEILLLTILPYFVAIPAHGPHAATSSLSRFR
jgi:hypothetical protein